MQMATCSSLKCQLLFEKLAKNEVSRSVNDLSGFILNIKIVPLPVTSGIKPIKSVSLCVVDFNSQLQWGFFYA